LLGIIGFFMGLIMLGCVFSSTMAEVNQQPVVKEFYAPIADNAGNIN
jgi:hypothetical protein